MAQLVALPLKSFKFNSDYNISGIFQFEFCAYFSHRSKHWTLFKFQNVSIGLVRFIMKFGQLILECKNAFGNSGLRSSDGAEMKIIICSFSYISSLLCPSENRNSDFTQKANSSTSLHFPTLCSFQRVAKRVWKQSQRKWTNFHFCSKTWKCPPLIGAAFGPADEKFWIFGLFGRSDVWAGATAICRLNNGKLI